MQRRPFFTFLPFQDLSCDTHILDTSVRTGANDNLIDRNVTHLIDRSRILRKVREGYGRL